MKKVPKGLRVYIVSRRGRDIDRWETTTADLEKATAEAIDLLGLPPDVVLRREKRGERT